MVNPLKLDPTRTGLLRKKYRTEITRSFNDLTDKIIEYVVIKNGLGLEIPTGNAVKYKPTVQKVGDFKEWLDANVSKYIIKRYWTDRMVGSAHKRGILRGVVNRPGYTISSGVTQVDKFLKSKDVKINTLQNLRQRTFDDLEGITKEMSDQISDVITVGYARNVSPLKMALNIVDRVQKIGLTRALMLVNNEISRAYNEGILDSMEALGETKLGVNVEWHTTSAPCEICAPLDGMILSLQEARGLLPRHVNCLCSFEPSKTTRRKNSLMAKISKSLKAEIPKSMRSKRKSVAEQKKRSKWMGAKL